MDLERRHGDSKEAVESGKWIQVQKRIFTRWANAYLKIRKLHITDLCTDLKDGILLIQLLEILARSPFPYKVHEKPKMEIHEHENLKAAFRYMTERGMEFRNIGAIDVHQGNEKIILGLIWTIISFFQVGEISLDGVSGRDGLLLWAQRNTQGYPGVEVTEFSKSWKDGLAWCALIHRYRPDVVDFSSLNPANHADNLALAFQLAEDYFGIDRILDVEDIMEAPKPDEKIVITYVAFCFKGYAEFLKRQGYAKAIGKAVDITKKHDAWILQYNAEAQALSDWIAASTAAYTAREHGTTAAQVKGVIDEFNSYKAAVKPEWKAKKTQLEGLYNTFASSARNNDRPIYQPPAGLSVRELEAAWATLEQTENEFESSVRGLYSQFVKVENGLANFALKSEKVRAWIASNTAVFNGGEYGASLVAAETLIAAYASFETQLVNVRQTIENMRGWASAPSIERHEQYAPTIEALAELEASLASTVELGQAYAAQLELSRERHEKTNALDKVTMWMDEQLAFFGQNAFGNSLLESNALLEEFASWSVQLEPKKELLSTITSSQQELLDRIAQEQAKLASVEEAAGTYHSYLLLTQEFFEKMSTMDKVAAWMDAQDALFAKEQYGDDLAATTNLLSVFNETFRVNLPVKKGVLDNMQTSQEGLLERLTAERSHMDNVIAASEYYVNQLQLAQERYEKLPILDRVQGWMSIQNDVFQAAQYGANLAEVASLLSAFGTFQTDVTPQQEVLNNMVSNQEVINERQRDLQAQMGALVAAAEDYQAQLLCSQERFEKLPILDRVSAWIESQRMVFSTQSYGDSLAEVTDLLSGYESFVVNFPSQQATVTSIASEQAVIKDRIAATLAALDALNADAQAYHEQVLLSRERHHKLPVLDRVDGWLDRQLQVFAQADYGDTLAAVATLLSSFESFTVNLPANSEILNSMESSQDTIVSRIAQLKEKLASTEAAGAEYHQQLQFSQERIEKFAMIERVEEWMNSQNQLFGARNYGDTPVAVATLLSAFDTFTVNVGPKKQVLDSMTSTQQVILDRLAAAQSTMAATEDAAAEYQAQLYLSQERFEKLAVLARVEEWLDVQDRMFATDNYGDTLAAVSTLLSSFSETYQVGVAAKVEVLDALTSEQQTILDELARVRGRMAATQAAAEQYKQQVLDSQERLEKLPALDRVQEWLDVQDAFFAQANYGDSLVAVSTLLSSFETFGVNLPSKREVLTTMTSQQELIVTRLQELSARLASTEAVAQQYHQELLLSQERLEKLPALNRVQEWLTAQDTVFASQDYGDSLVAVSNLMEAFGNFQRQLKVHEEALTALTSTQDAIATEHSTVSQHLQSTEAAGAQYYQELAWSQERFEKLPPLARGHDWAASYEAVFSSAQYGESLTAVETLLDQHKLFETELPPYKELADSMESAQQVVLDQLLPLRSRLAALATAADEYHTQLILSQERLEKLPALDKAETWLKAEAALFEAGDYGDSLQAVARLSDVLAQHYEPLLKQHQETVNGMQSGQDAILTRLHEVQTVMANTVSAGQAYAAALEGRRAHLQHLVDLNKTYNKQADEFVFSTEQMQDMMNEPITSDDLPGTTRMVEDFHSTVKPSLDNLTNQYNEIDTIARELMEAGVNEAFTRHSLQDLYDKYVVVYEQLTSREQTLTHAFEMDKYRDDLRQHFASVAASVKQYCEQQSSAVGALQGSLEDQLAALTAMITEYQQSTLMQAAEESAQALAGEGIVDNTHTTETIYSLRAVWDALDKVFNGAEESLKAQMLAARDEHITPEQYREIKEVFEYFDVDGDSGLSVTEFHSCLTGIGIVMTDEEVAGKHRELDTTGDGMLRFDEFAAFMVGRLVEPGHTKADVDGAFVELAEKSPYLPAVLLRRTFTNMDHLNYLNENMEGVTLPDDGTPGFKLEGFVDQLFTR